MAKSLVVTPRSWLFCPGDRTDRLAKAVAGADVAIADLEDAVGADSKDAARAAVAGWLRENPEPAARVWVRINNDPVNTSADLEALAGCEYAGIVVPKAETAVVAEIASRTSVPLLALIETAAGLWQARELAGHESVATLTLGEYDLAVDLGVSSPDTDDAPLLWARSQVVAAAAAAKCAPPPGPVSAALEDLDRYRADTERLARFGFFGRMCIHPRQVPIVHDALRPAEDAVARARKVVAAAAEAESSGQAVLVVDGKMVDAPLVNHARRVLTLADRD